MEPEIAVVQTKRRRPLSLIAGPLKPAISGTAGCAITEPQSAAIVTSARTVGESTRDRNVQRKIESSEEYMCPKFTRDLLWGAVEDDISPSARYSLFSEPLPRPPLPNSKTSLPFKLSKAIQNFSKLFVTLMLKNLRNFL
jgi:hypothetical protein